MPDAVSSEVLDTIEAALAEMENDAEGGDASTAYALQMWRFLLALWREEPLEASEHVVALPYLPIDLAAHGLELGAEDLVLDIGCQGGYGLCDLALRRRQAGAPVPRLMGLDVDARHLRVAQAVAPAWRGSTPLLFLRGSMEALPLARGAAALVVCRLVLPYVALVPALRELGRVLRPGGLALLQLHAGGYYRQQLLRAWRHPRQVVYFLKPLVAQALLRWTGRQCRHRLLRETALDVPGLARLAEPHGLSVVWAKADDPRPLALLRRASGGGA